MLVDSGASVSVIKPGIVTSELQATRLTAKGITGGKLKVIGTQEIMFRVGNRSVTHEFLVAPIDAEYSGILGVDVLRNMEARIDFRTSMLSIGRKRYSLLGQDGERSRENHHQCRQMSEVSEPGLASSKKIPSQAKAEMSTPKLSSRGTDTEYWNVVVFESVVLPPLSEGLVIGKIESRLGTDVSGEVLVEPRGLPTPGAFGARVLSRVLNPMELRELRSHEVDGSGTQEDESTREKRAEDGRNSRQMSGARYCVLKVLNTRGQFLELGKNILIGIAEPFRGTYEENESGV
jgi:hypothetical protein